MKLSKKMSGIMLCALVGLVCTNTTLYAAKRPIPPRVKKPWREIVAQRRQEYLANPNAEKFKKSPKLKALELLEEPAKPAVYSANEADPVDALLTEWWCSSNGVPDVWDEMWMSIIGETVNAGATPHVYLFSYLGDNDQTTLANCSAMLEAQEGISADQVRWIQDFATDAFWIRDFGPFFVRDKITQDLSIEDAKYYPGRSNDDDQPKDFAARISVPVNDLNLFFEGGNFLPNGGGLCIVSSVTVDANPHYSETEIRQLFQTSLGCEELIIVQTLEDAATGHVDMWLAWADRTTLIVGEYSHQQDAANRAIIENNITTKLAGLVDPETQEPIEIVRMPMPSNCPPPYFATKKGKRITPPHAAKSCSGLPAHMRDWRTYLNVVIINDTVLVPVYEQDTRYEEESLAIWESLGFNAVPIASDYISPSAGQLHCITKTLPAAQED